MMNNCEIYNDGLKQAFLITESLLEEFSDLVIQLSMSGEFSNISDLFEEGQDLNLSVGDFINSNDVKVQGMIKILNSLRDFQDMF